MHHAPDAVHLTDVPHVPQPEGWWRSLDAWVQDFGARAGLDCSCLFTCVGHGGAAGKAAQPDQWPAPSAEVAQALVHILQDLLSNVVCHAMASEAQVRIRVTMRDVSLLVKDNGRGAPPSAFEGRDAPSMQAVRRRALLLGGWLHVDSQIDRGTQVILTLPWNVALPAPACVSAGSRHLGPQHPQ